VAGVTETLIGISFTTVLADFVGSAVLVALIITACALETDGGGVYTAPVPFGVSEPVAGMRDHVRPVFEVADTVVVKTRFCPGLNELEAGVIDTATGSSDITALAVLLLSHMLVAVIVTFCAAGIDDGAVYTPLDEIDPTAGLIVQTTPAAPVT